MSPCGQRKRSSSNIWEVNPGVSTDPLGVSCDNEKWWGSNYGSELDVVAPGVLIPTTDIQGSAGYNTTDGTGGNYYQTFNGTSSATPHVAGVAALILSVNPGLTQDQVRNIIESTCTKVGSYSYSTVTGRSNGIWNSEVGYGCVNAYAAIQAIYPAISGPSIVCSSGADFGINLPPGATIIWNQSSYSLTRVSPQGSNPCTFAANYSNGYGWIGAQIVTCGDTITLPNVSIRTGINVNDFSFEVWNSSGQFITTDYGLDILCPNVTYDIYVVNNGECETTDYTWNIPSWWTQIDAGENWI